MQLTSIDYEEGKAYKLPCMTHWPFYVPYNLGKYSRLHEVLHLDTHRFILVISYEHTHETASIIHAREIMVKNTEDVHYTCYYTTQQFSFKTPDDRTLFILKLK